MALQGHPSKVVDFGTNRKCLCDFLLVINSNLGCILLRFRTFRNIAGFLLITTPPLFHPNFRCVPLDYIADVLAPRSEDPKLIIRVINIDSPTYTRTVHQRQARADRRTDGRTDDLR